MTSILIRIWPLLATMIILILTATVLEWGLGYTSNIIEILTMVVIIGCLIQLIWYIPISKWESTWTKVKNSSLELNESETEALLNNTPIVVSYMNEEINVNPNEVGIAFDSKDDNYVDINLSKNKLGEEQLNISIHMTNDRSKNSNIQLPNTE